MTEIAAARYYDYIAINCCGINSKTNFEYSKKEVLEILEGVRDEIMAIQKDS